MTVTGWDTKKINSLFPGIRADVIRFLEKAHEQGLHVHIFEGYRSFERQAELYARGRTKPGKIVTNSPPGFSFHNYGLAIDLVFDGQPRKPGIQWDWDKKYDWRSLGVLGESLGFEWAGRWERFPEYPHFQRTYGFRIHQLKAKWDELSKGNTYHLLAFWEWLEKEIKGS